MKQANIPQKKPKVVLRQSPLALKIILTLLILFSIASLVALRWVHLEMRKEIGSLKTQAAQVEYANELLEQKSENIGGVNTIQDIARDELGLVDPNTVVITPDVDFTEDAASPPEAVQESGESLPQS